MSTGATPAVWLLDDGSATASSLAQLSFDGRLPQRVIGRQSTPPPECTCALLPMGDVDRGIEDFRRLRRDGYRGAVIFFATNPRPEQIRAALNAGAQDVIDPVAHGPVITRRAVAMAGPRLDAFREIRSGGEHRRAWIRDRLAEAQNIAHVGSWEIDVSTWTAEWSPEFRRVVGIGPDEPPLGVEGYAARVHPDDRDRVMTELMDLIRGGHAFDTDHRLIREDGVERTLIARGRSALNADGTVRRVYGTIQDVTETRCLEESLRRERDFSAALLGALHDGYFLTKASAIADVNEVLIEMTGFPREELMGALRPYPFWGEDDIADLKAKADRIIADGGGNSEATLTRKDGGRFEAMLASRPARDAHGNVLAWVTTVRDISEQKQHERALSRMATEDALTGLLNRRAFDLRLEEEFARVARSRRPASLVLLDIDHFKAVNDTFGHPMGDVVLREIAGRMRDTVRSGDVIARVGGEEMAWILPDSDLENARLAAERARRAINIRPFETVGRVTASFGVSLLTSAIGPTAAYKAADGALYEAKHRGRNCVQVADDTELKAVG